MEEADKSRWRKKNAVGTAQGDTQEREVRIQKRKKPKYEESKQQSTNECEGAEKVGSS